MSIFTTIGRVFSKVGGIAATVVGIGKQMLPFIRAARELSPDVDRIVDAIEANVLAGGTAADDWLDKNVEGVEALDGFFEELAAVAAAGRDVTQAALQFSMFDTPDTITPAEAEILVAKLALLRAKLAALGTREDIEAVLTAL